jgi:hypothetical protein
MDEEINVMSAMDVVKEGLAATEAGDFGKLESLVADDFAMSGPVPMPVGKREFIGLMMAMLKAMPDWKFNATDFKENGDQVMVPLRITGTHRRIAVADAGQASRAKHLYRKEWQAGETASGKHARWRCDGHPVTTRCEHAWYVVHTPSASNLGISSGRLTGSRPLDIYQPNK